jgi:8-oxo-dGTP pyrophosphatase MutT (NUDIX family)
MHRDKLIQSISNYKIFSKEDEVIKNRFLNFIATHKNCFERSLEIGHITASAFIIDKKNEKILLLHHKKLDKWLQPGGHCDGEENVLKVAIKEVFEETGINIAYQESDIFDLDIHTIPLHKNIPKHEHFDIRFLFDLDSTIQTEINEESNQLAWVSMNDLENYTNEESILRMRKKSFLI